MKIYKIEGGGVCVLTLNPSYPDSKKQKYFCSFTWKGRGWTAGAQFAKPEVKGLEKIKIFKSINPTEAFADEQAVELLEKIQGLYHIYEYGKLEEGKRRKAERRAAKNKRKVLK